MSTPGELLINLYDRSVEQGRELHGAKLQIEQLANALWNACEVIDDLRAGCAEVWPVDEIVGHARELIAKARKSETEDGNSEVRVTVHVAPGCRECVEPMPC